MQVPDVGIEDQQRLVLTMESGLLEASCPACGVLAVGHGRPIRILHDAPCFGHVTVLRWLVRMWDGTTVSALARQLGMDWHTCWQAIEVEARARTSGPARLQRVKTLGVDDHTWRPSRIGVHAPREAGRLRSRC